MRIYLVVIFFSSCVIGSAQGDINSFDFWIGEWELTWELGDGSKGHGTNSIIKILDGKVIQENFKDLGSGFKGMSLSVFNPQKKIWHQAWTDNAGGYYDFIGEINGDQRIFRTRETIEEGKTVIRRMAFKNISKDSLIWNWEKTTDDGKNWKLLWRIHYRRK